VASDPDVEASTGAVAAPHREAPMSAPTTSRRPADWSPVSSATPCPESYVIGAAGSAEEAVRESRDSLPAATAGARPQAGACLPAPASCTGRSAKCCARSGAIVGRDPAVGRLGKALGASANPCYASDGSSDEEVIPQDYDAPGLLGIEPHDAGRLPRARDAQSAREAASRARANVMEGISDGGRWCSRGGGHPMGRRGHARSLEYARQVAGALR